MSKETQDINESFLSSLLTVFGTGNIISMMWRLYRATKDPEIKRLVNDKGSSNQVLAKRAKNILQKYKDDKKYGKYLK
jgi:hypothetical protein